MQLASFWTGLYFNWTLFELTCNSIGTSESEDLKYVRYVDLPGNCDTNIIRDRAAEEKIMECDALWVFGSISRAADDLAVRRAVNKYGGKFGDKFVVVLTKADESVANDTIDRLKKKGIDASEITKLTKDLKTYRKGANKASKDHTYAMSKDSWDEVQKYTKLCNQAENRLFTCKVEAVGGDAVEEFRKNASIYMPDGVDLKVFAVSSMHFQVHTGRERICAPLMSVAATQIPQLREWALMMAAPQLWRNRSENVSSVLGLFQGMSLVIKGCTENDRSKLLNTVKQLDGIQILPFTELVAQRNKIVQDCFVSPLRAKGPDSRCEALDGLEDIKSWHTSSFLAWYKRSGQHVTKARGAVSFNEIMQQWQTQQILEPLWHRDLVPQLESSLCNTKEKVLDSIEKTEKTILESDACVSLDKGAIQQLFIDLRNGVQSDYEEISEACNIAMLTIRTYATKNLSASYFTTSMQPAYDAGKTDDGTGVKQRCLGNLHNHLVLPADHVKPLAPFTAYHDKLEAALQKNNQDYSRVFEDSVEARIRRLIEHNELITAQKPDTPETLMARRDLKVFYDSVEGKLNHVCEVYKLLKEKASHC